MGFMAFFGADWAVPAANKSNRWSIDEGIAAKNQLASLTVILAPVETPSSVTVTRHDGTPVTITEGSHV